MGREDIIAEVRVAIKIQFQKLFDIYMTFRKNILDRK